MKNRLLLFSGVLLSASYINAEISEDYTSYILNPGFEEGALNNDQAEVKSWNVINEHSGWGRVALWSDNSAEGTWHLSTWSDVIRQQDIYQVIENMPKGKYTLSAQLRTEDEASLTTQHIYATVSGSTFHSDTLNEKGVGTTAYNWQTLSVQFYVSGDNIPVRIGAQTTGGDNPGGGRGWFKLDDFRLTFHGDNTEALIETLTNKINEAKNVNTEDYTTLAKDQIAAAIEFAEAAMENLITSDKAIKDLADAIEYGEKSVAAFNTYKISLENAWWVYNSTQDGSAKNALKGIIDFAASEVENDDYTNDEFYSCAQYVDNAVKVCVDQGEPVEGCFFDVSDYIINRSFENNVSHNGQGISGIIDFGWEFTEEAEGWGGFSLWNDYSAEGTYHLSTARESLISQDVYQLIDELRPGNYRMTAVMRTNTLEDLTTQHIYATVGDDTNRTFMTENGVGTTDAAWELLEVPFVIDPINNYVVIGVASTGDGGQNGWFKADDFRLYYHGTNAVINNIETTEKDNSSTDVYGGKGFVSISSVYAQQIKIFTIDGRLNGNYEVIPGTNKITLAPGAYIINGSVIMVY